MALVLTPGRLLMLETGNGGKVKGFLGEYPIGQIGGMEVKRLGLGAAITVIIRDTPVRLESRVGPSREFAAVLTRFTDR